MPILVKIFHIYAKNIHVQIGKFMIISMQEKIQEKINERINFLEDLYSETMKIDDEEIMSTSFEAP